MKDIDKRLREAEEKARETFLSQTIKPKYYHKGGIDVIGFMGTKANKDEQVGFLRWNIIKYVTRYREKNGVEDLNKAKYYLDQLIELENK